MFDARKLVIAIDNGREFVGLVEVESEVPEMAGTVDDGTEIDRLGYIPKDGFSESRDKRK